MATDTVTIEQFAKENGITLSATRADRNPHMDDSRDMDHWKVTLKRKGEPLPPEEVISVENGADPQYDDNGNIKVDMATCGVCNRSWNDALITGSTPAPAGRCPYEYYHGTRTVRMTLYFSKGYGHNGAEPEVAEVLDCLASDAAGIDNAQGFEEWCSEYGYDTDSRKAEKTFKACEHEAKRLRNFLGDDLYAQLLYHTERM